MARSKIVALGILSQTAGRFDYTNYRGFGGTLSFASGKPLPKHFQDYEPQANKYFYFEKSDSVNVGVSTDDVYSLTPSGAMLIETLHILPDPVNAVIFKPFADHWWSRDVAEFEAGQVSDRGADTIDPILAYSGGSITAFELPNGDTYSKWNAPIGLQWFKPKGAADETYWMDGMNGQHILMSGTRFPAMYYRNASEPDVPCGLESRFALGVEPMFCIGLWRDTPSEEMTETPATRINFGKARTEPGANAQPYSREWELIIPYYGTMKLMVKDTQYTNDEWVELQKVTEGSIKSNDGSAPKQTSITQEGLDMETLWVGCFGNYICVSQDAFESYVAVFDRTVAEPSDVEPFGAYLTVDSSSVIVTNVGGQWAMSWVPIYFSRSNPTVYSDVHNLPYAIEDNPAWDANDIMMNFTYIPVFEDVKASYSYSPYPVQQIVYEALQAKDSNCRKQVSIIDIAQYDDEGNPILDGEGDPVTLPTNVVDGHYGFDFITTLTRIVKQSSMHQYWAVLDTGETGAAVSGWYSGRWDTTDPWPASQPTFWNFGDLEIPASPVYQKYLDGGASELPFWQHCTPILFRVDYYAPTSMSQNTDLNVAGNYRAHMLSSFSYDLVDGGATGGFTVDAEDAYGATAYPFGDYHDGFRMYPAGIVAGWMNHDGSITLPTELVDGHIAIDPVTGDATWETTAETTLMSGYAQQPTTTIDNGKVSTEFSLIDILAVGKDVLSDGTLPPFDGWYVYDAVIWLLEYMGISSSYYTGTRNAWDGSTWTASSGSLIENTGLRLNKGKRGEPLWVPAEGTSILDFLNEICLYDYGAALTTYYGKVTKGCPYCHALRSATSGGFDYVGNHVDPSKGGCTSYDAVRVAGGIDYHFITSEGERVTQSLDYAPLEQEIISLQPELDASRDNYYNSVKVKGHSIVSPYKAFEKEFNDWNSILGYAVEGDAVTYLDYAIGYKKQLVIEREWINSQEIANRVLAWHWYKHSSVMRRVSITVPFSPFYQLGQVFAVYGQIADSVAMRNRKFRITGVSNTYEASGGMTNTVITATDIGSV